MRTLSSQGFHMHLLALQEGMLQYGVHSLPDHDICATCVDTALESS